MDDIASDAGVSVATAYGHYSKDTLIGHVYAPLIAPLVTKAQAEIDGAEDPTRALSRHVRDLMRVAYQNHNLSIALLHALQSRSLLSGGPPRAGDMSDVRNLVPAPKPMADLIEYGQRSRVFVGYPSAMDIATYHTNAAFLQLVTRPRRRHTVATRVVLSQLIPAVQLADSSTD